MTIRKYDSAYEQIMGNKICYYCGEPMQSYEDRQGCDYRESGDFYYFCTCEQSYAEEEYFKEKKKIEFEMNIELRNRLNTLDEKYENKLKRIYDLNELKYRAELDAVNRKFGK